MSSTSRNSGKRAGAVLVWLLLSLSVLISAAALVIDGGRMMAERRRAQAVADAAALAAAADLYAHHWTYHGLDPKSTAQAAAVQALADNGYADAALTVNIPPQSGPYAGQAGHVEVILERDIEASFSRIFTRSNLAVKARGVARGHPMKLGVILLRSSGADAFLNKSPAFTLVNAPLIVNSADSAAFNQNSIGVLQAERFLVTGDYINPGGALILGKIRKGARPTPDPLALLPVPEDSAQVRSLQPLVLNLPLAYDLQPGVYQGGISIGGQATVKMQPGVYIMQGGGFQIGENATAIGQEVMVYNTIGSSPTGPIEITTLGKVVLSAPMSGDYQGINFFQNRSLTNAVTLTGNGLNAITGVVYAAKAPIHLTGSLALKLDILGGAYVADSMRVQGAGSINVDIGLNPPRVPDVRLVD